MKIAFVVVYFGQWPPWFPAFVHSCRFNPDVDWLFFTECAPPSSGAPNVRFIPFSMAEFNDLATRVLGTIISLSGPYKLCDFKAAYGHLFSEHLAGYDFWGHCDVDVIWGNVRRIITDESLQSYDIISARKNVMCGHFSLFRNQPHITRLYERIPDYRQMLTWPAHHGICEQHMSSLVHRCAASSELRVLWSKFLLNFANPKTDRPGQLGPIVNGWYWERGTLFNLTEATRDEVMYLHFMTWKDTLTRCEFGFDDRPDSFYISYSHIGLPERESHEERGLDTGPMR